MEENVILVDLDDNPIGTCEKIEAHKKGLLHRAISVFIFNSQGELLIQRRADHKYHSGGLWSNTCCSHPPLNEEISAFASKRLQEEMGIDCELKEVFDFVYQKNFENGLIEYELDHVFIGLYDGEVNLNVNEASEFKWVSYDSLSKDISLFPEKYTFWFKLVFENVFTFI